MKFSSEQEKIIYAKLDNNLVSASAGSGKTTVLTARIGDEVSSGQLSTDAMLVVTFTEDAASHMADKIEEKLRSLHPLILDTLPVNFEELFIYEHEGGKQDVQRNHHPFKWRYRSTTGAGHLAD